MNKTPKKSNTELGYVKPREITEEMKESYIDYAMSVIIARALPDARDGLKPVQRRILYAMYGMGLVSSARFRKSAAVTGDVLGKYHPHGDISVYDALVRMAQDFSFRYPLVKGQGNFGSIDGDPPSAMRYSEARLSKIGEAMLRDIERNTVDFVDNYDGTKKEPKVLPSPLPQLLLNGSLGIAVGMATNIPPHNLSEVCDAAIYLIDNPKADTEDLFKFVKGPDFPLGGQVFDQKEILEAYSQGRGPILMRGKVEVLENKKAEKTQIIISEIPYQVQKSSLVENIALLVQNKKIDGIKDIRDESDREGIRIVIDLQKDAFPQKILNRLYKFTDLQKTFYLNLLALAKGVQPQTLSLAQVLSYFLDHRKEVVFRRTQHDLDKAKQRAHILKGLDKCLSKIDAVIRTIRASKNREEAQRNLIKNFKLTSIQANAILETKLSALAKLERKRIEDELKETLAKIKELSLILKSPARIKTVIKKELSSLKESFGDQRRTKVFVQKIGEFKEEDLIPQEETIITLTNSGYIKRISPQVYKIQKRGGKGILGMKTVGEDIIEHFLLTKTHYYLLLFSDSGKVFRIPAYEIPQGTRVSKGRGLLNFLEISPQEKILAIFATSNKPTSDLEEKYMAMVTKNGIIKKTSLKEFENIRKSGLIAIHLKKGDELREVKECSRDDDVILVTQKGQSIRFKESQIRPMGRAASGLIGIRMKKGDLVMGLGIIKPQISETLKQAKEKLKQYLLVVTENGFGKRSDLEQYRSQTRGGLGIRTVRITPKTGNLASFKVLSDEENLIIISKKGQVIKTKINSIAKLSRITQGVKVIRLDSEDKIASIICV